MKEILKYAEVSKIIKNNYFLIRSLETEEYNDRTIKILSREVTDLILKLYPEKMDQTNKD